MNKTPSISYYCTMETLSPVHVGSGVKYLQNMDFLYDHSIVYITDTRKLFDALQESTTSEDISDLTVAIEKNSFFEWLEKRGISIKKFARARYPLSSLNSKEILEHMRDGWGNPFVPGSSLKGSFRTAVLRDLVDTAGSDTLKDLKSSLRKKEKLGNKELQRADAMLTRKLLGKDPNHDLFRTLSVGDFKFNKEALSLHSVSIKSLQRKGGLGEKKFKIFPELLAIGNQAFGLISFDNFLPLQDQAKAKKIFGFKVRITLDYLRSVSLDLSTKIAKKERDFFLGRNKSVASFYENLLRKIDCLEENELITRISWGSGWKSMTGELLTEKDLDKDMREKLKLAPHRLAFEFPKSRKIVTTEGGDFPLGWVKISFREMDSVRAEENEEKKRREYELKEQRRLKDEEERRRREEEQRKALIANLPPEDRDIARVKEPSISEQEIVEIYRRIDQFPDGKRKELALALKEYWIKKGKWSGKISNKQMKKVNKIKSILGE